MDLIESIPPRILIALVLVTFVLLVLPTTKRWQARHDRLRQVRQERRERRRAEEGE